MSKNKKININPAFFNITPKKGGKRKEKKTKPKTTLKINNVKKALMKKVKEHRQKKLKLQNNDNISKEQSEFQSSLNYLETISKQNKKKKKSNISINNNLTNNNLTNNNLASPYLNNVNIVDCRNKYTARTFIETSPQFNKHFIVPSQHHYV